MIENPEDIEFTPCALAQDEAEMVTIFLKDCPTVVESVGTEGVTVGRELGTEEIVQMSVPYELFRDRPSALKEKK